MTKKETKRLTGFTAEECQGIMVNCKYSPLPERPMLPGTKMSGSDNRTVWTENFLAELGEGWKSSATNDVAAGAVGLGAAEGDLE